jgi:hypothetical protein
MPNFPQFRKLQNTDVVYAISSPTRFTEWKCMGKFYSVHELEATQYPEMLRINDMLECIDSFEKIEESDFEALCKKWESELTRVDF